MEKKLSAIDIARKNKIAYGPKIELNDLQVLSKPTIKGNFVQFTARDAADINASAYFVEEVYIDTNILSQRNGKSVLPKQFDTIFAIVEDDSYNGEDALGLIVRAFINEKGVLYPGTKQNLMPSEQWHKLRKAMRQAAGFYENTEGR